MQLLVVHVPERRPAQQLGQALAEGVADLGDHAGELPVRPVAPEEGHRVEDVAEHAQLGQQQDLRHGRVSGEGDPACLTAPPSKWSV